MISMLVPALPTHCQRRTALCPRLSVRTSLPSSRHHTRAVLSHDAVTTYLPSGVTHTDSTVMRCPLSVCTCKDLVMIHTRTVSSAERKAAQTPSEKFTAYGAAGRGAITSRKPP
eukprot:1695650-Pleurochrysis_carterae.AAC.2